MTPRAHDTDARLLSQTSWRESALITATFVLLLLPVVLSHEMWRDETGMKSLIESSSSFANANAALRYGGHPRLWPLLLFSVWRLTGSDSALRALHLALSTASVFLVARYSPFGRLQKLLLIFSYFIFYEYGVIFRDYALGVFLLLLACVVFERQRSPLVLSAVLALAVHANVYALILSVGLASAWWIRDPSTLGRWHGRAAATILIAAVTSSALQMKPPADTGFARGWNCSFQPWRFGWTISRIWTSYVPIPAAGPHLWNTNILGKHLPVPALLSAVFFSCAISLFARRRSALVLLLFATAGILLFTYTKFSGSLRHHGHLFVAFVLAWWIGESERPFSALQRLFLTALLVAQCTAGAWLAIADLALPFSVSGQTASFIAAHFPNSTPVVAYPDAPTSAVACQLGRSVYYPERRRWGTFLIWNNQTWPVSRSELIDCVRRIASERQSDVLVLLQEDVRLPSNPFEPIASFGSGMVADEGYRIFLCRKNPIADARDSGESSRAGPTGRRQK